jgi:pimeloyl-ACP methyl ester carboxylesterase
MNLTRFFTTTLAALTIGMLAGCSYLPDYSSLEQSGVSVSERRDCIVILPASGAYASVGFLFLPGGLVDPHAYVEPLSRVVRESPGYAVVIAKESANLAILSTNAALALTGEVPGVSRWAVGGHSLGGVIAAGNVYANPSLFSGLVLEAAYPQNSQSLASSSIPVLSISAEFDGLATKSKIDSNKNLLPANTEYEVIAGGCHAFFGSYGAQDGDGTPTVTKEEQQKAAADCIVSFLGAL